jgi:glutamate--cysteine ligase
MARRESLGDECLGVEHAPVGLPTDETIPVARFGPMGRPKRLQLGLSHRYRRIATDFGITTGRHRGQQRAVLRLIRTPPAGVLLLYLFGASPLHVRFVNGRQHELQQPVA